MTRILTRLNNPEVPGKTGKIINLSYGINRDYPAYKGRSIIHDDNIHYVIIPDISINSGIAHL
jgi:hypothetical protein